MDRETIELSQPILGMRPYVLIEADVDPSDGELVLKINAGGGAAEQIGSLPFMMLGQLPAEQNPLTMAIEEHLVEFPDDREALARFADVLGVPMPGGALNASETGRPWCGAPREFGGQQPCSIAEPCDERTCRIGRADGSEVYKAPSAKLSCSRCGRGDTSVALKGSSWVCAGWDADPANPKRCAVIASSQSSTDTRPEPSECTGLAARWCPVHGKCVCSEDGIAELHIAPTLDDPACSLHAPTSDHAETLTGSQPSGGAS